MNTIMRLTVAVESAKGCAWRARYLYLNGRQIAHIGVDPNNGVKPKAFGGVGGMSFRFTLPWVAWRYNASPLLRPLERMSSWFYHNLDGRYGWGTEYTKHNGALGLLEHMFPPKR